MNRFFDVIIGFFVALVFGLVWSLLLAFFGQFLWNYVVVSIFGLPEISYLKMLALMVFVRILIPMNLSNKD